MLNNIERQINHLKTYKHTYPLPCDSIIMKNNFLFFVFLEHALTHKHTHIICAMHSIIYSFVRSFIQYKTSFHFELGRLPLASQPARLNTYTQTQTQAHNHTHFITIIITTHPTNLNIILHYITFQCNSISFVTHTFFSWNFFGFESFPI